MIEKNIIIEHLNHLFFVLDYAANHKQLDSIADGHYQFAMYYSIHSLHHDLKTLVAFCVYLGQIQDTNCNIIFTDILEQVNEEAHDWQTWA